MWNSSHRSERAPIQLLAYSEFFFLLLLNNVMKILVDECIHISAIQNCLMDKTHSFSFTSHIFVENTSYFHTENTFNTFMSYKPSSQK